jgi:hypothetical protein
MNVTKSISIPSVLIPSLLCDIYEEEVTPLKRG